MNVPFVYLSTYHLNKKRKNHVDPPNGNIMEGTPDAQVLDSPPREGWPEAGVGFMALYS